MKIKLLLLTLIIMCACLSHAQQADTTHAKNDYREKSLSLLAGLQAGKYTYAELGIAMNYFKVVGYHPFSATYAASTEIRLTDKVLIGPKISGWVSGGPGGIAMGANAIYYTDFDNSSLVFRPEMGFEFFRLKLVYGYNLKITNKSFDQINSNLVSISYCLKLKKLKGG